MKKILSLVLVIAMMASLVVFAPASAADGATVEVTDAVAKAGDTVTVDVIVTGTTLYAYAFLVDFDESRLENPVIKTVNTEEFTAAGTIAGFTYSDASLTANCLGGAKDVSEGYHLVTITFDVKADAPAGDAYVRIIDNDASGKGDIFLAPTNDYKQNLLTWNSVAGSVTVLSEGYSVALPAETDSALLDYEENDAGTGIIINGFADESVSTLVIPAYIDDLPVVEIAKRAFRNDDTIEFLVIPATVTSIVQQAFQGIAENAVAYVLAETIDMGATAIEATIYSSATSDAKAYAEDEELPWFEYNAPTMTVDVVVGDTTSSFGVSSNSIVAPGASKVDGKQVIAWNVNGAIVAPGAEITIEGDTTITAVTVDIPETVYGASVKANANNAGLRFKADMDKATYDALVAEFGDAKVSHGMLITPQAYVEKVNGAFTHAALDAYAGEGNGYIDFAMTGCYEATETTYTLAATVTNFSETTVAKNPAFVAVAYIAVELEGGTAYVYGEYDWQTARDAKTVLTNVLADVENGFNATELGWIETWKGYFDNKTKA